MNTRSAARAVLGVGLGVVVVDPWDVSWVRRLTSGLRVGKWRGLLTNSSNATVTVLRLGDGGRLRRLSLAVLGSLGGARARRLGARQRVLRGHVVRLGAGRHSDGGGDAGGVAVPAVVLVAATVLATVAGSLAVVVLAVVLVLLLAWGAALGVVGTAAVAVEAARGEGRADRQAAAETLRVAHRVGNGALRVRLADDLGRDAVLASARGRLAGNPGGRRLGVGLRLAGNVVERSMRGARGAKGEWISGPGEW